MTSTAGQPNQTSAPNSSSTAAPSYASAAGATKKPTPTPLTATGANPPIVVGGPPPTAPASQNGKPASASPVNGRPNITPAIPVSAAPAIVHGASIINGAPNNHARKGSVTISANAPSSHIANGGPVGGSKASIQFGYKDSPAVAHSTPQPSVSAPIPIPGNNSSHRIPSPAQSPSPIPVPSATGGRPPSSAPPPNPMTFGSFPSEGDRHLKQPPVPQNPHAMGHQQAGTHNRRDSQVSAHGDMPTHGGHGPSRGGYQGQGGRGGRNFTAPYNNQQMGFPPNNHNQQRYGGGPNTGRGGMQYQPGRNSIGPYPNSPQPPRASPAQAPAVPHLGTPNMSQAVPIPAQQQGFYGPPHLYQQQVYAPPSQTDSFTFSTGKSHKKKGAAARRDYERSSHTARQPSSSYKQNNQSSSFYQYNGSRRSSMNSSRRDEPRREWNANIGGSSLPPACSAGPPPYDFVPFRSSSILQPTGEINLSPESGNFEKLLTAKKQMGQMGMYPNQPFDAYGRPISMGAYPNYGAQPQYMNQGPPATGPGFNQGFVNPYQPGPPAAQPMSRNSSQVSERPSSSTGHSQAPLIAQTPSQRSSQPTPPAVVQGTSRQAPKNKRIVIKTPSGDVLDLDKIKAPASPATASHLSTPPVVASTPTPPPKPSTPLHTRTDSAAVPGGKTAEQIKSEFAELVRKTAEGSEGPSENKAKADEAAAATAAEEKAADEEKSKKEEEQRAKEAERLSAEKKAEEEVKAQQQEVKAQQQAAAEAKAKSEAEAKAKAEAEAESKAKADAATVAAEDKSKTEKPEETEDEALERMIREMEEEDARREKEQAELTLKKKAAAEEAKKRADADKERIAAENDAKLKEQEREMERLEEERERQRAEREAKAAAGGESVADLLAKKIEDLKLSDKKDAATPSSVADELANLNISTDSSASTPAPKTGGSDKARTKPTALNLIVPSKPVEPPQPSAALQSLKSARWLGKDELYDPKNYPSGFSSPNPALNSAVTRKNKSFKYDAQFLLQFQKVFTEEPSLEFHQQIKSLIGEPDGGSRSASTRSAGPGTGRSASKAGSAGGFPSMGQFASKPLPLGSGTTSAERFAMSQGQISRPAMGNPMASFGGRGGFPSSQGMSRTPSSANAGGMPNSPRQGSRRGGGGSKRDGFSGGGQNAKNMPLTAGQELKPIAVTASGWKPTSIGNKAAQAPIAALAQQGHLDPEMVQRKVKAALNKMTPEKFDKISDQILTIAGQSKNEQDGRTLRQVIQLTFEKATDEAHWASMYAKFCKRMLETMSPEIRDESILDKNGNVVSGGALFRKYLLNRCQEEFERGWKVDLPEQPADEDGKKTGEAALLSDEYYIAAAAKRRGLGLVQFIGELFKLGMLTERIMHECVRKLLEFQGIPDEAEIESLTKLLRTIGGNLDSTDKGRGMMDAYFQRIQNIMDIENLPSRLKFMLMDVVDLRRANWASKEANKGPKTLKEIQAEAEAAAAQKAAESARSNQRGGPGGGRPQAGRGDARNFSAYNQALQNQIGSDDLRRLKGSATRTPSASASFGPTSMFSSRSNSGRRLVPGGGFGRAGEDSGASSRTGTPPTAVAHTNAFGLLADSADHPASPPSTKASPALTKASLEGDEKKEA